MCKVKIKFADGLVFWQSNCETCGGCVMRNVLVAGFIGLGILGGCSFTPPTLKTEPTKLSSGEI